MSNIKVNLPKIRKSSVFTYADLHLDLLTNRPVSDAFNARPQHEDLQADFDIAAVRTSIINLFLTAPGEKILNPAYGMDLRVYLFEPVSVTIAGVISDVITTNVRIYEPRVQLTKLEVIPDPENQQYTINMFMNIPLLRVNQFIIKTHLNSQGYAVFN